MTVSVLQLSSVGRILQLRIMYPELYVCTPLHCDQNSAHGNYSRSFLVNSRLLLVLAAILVSCLMSSLIQTSNVRLAMEKINVVTNSMRPVEGMDRLRG